MIQLGENAWQIPVLPRQALNCFLLGDVLVDAGLPFCRGKLLSALTGKAVGAHVVTHAHADHQGATAAVAQALNLPVWCHATERAAIETGDVLSSFDNPRSLTARFQQRFLAGASYPVTRTLAQGDMVGGFEVIETPGHTAGHISLWRASDGLLVAGDAALGMNLLTTRPGLHLPFAHVSWDMAHVRGSVRKLAALSPRRVAFGHGPAIDGASFIAFADTLN
ncbi:MBL fold metallo-hydrolase [uncultured Tateyamaria sp.]|uniref:MBL fold metallo-hydrolase n=1 Tax=uncultured Tateyamaria sp. TaxID=455651 RepID=UPI002626E604|nr:MBL fold metallo-hydrolase [uncultured Tateyamaria sp.]